MLFYVSAINKTATKSRFANSDFIRNRLQLTQLTWGGLKAMKALTTDIPEKQPRSFAEREILQTSPFL